MSRANVSGFRLEPDDIPIVLGMIARGDRRHDIAAWFGVNQGRIKNAQDGKYGTPPVAPPQDLPPRGAPGIKGRRLREAVIAALAEISEEDNLPEAVARLEAALANYDANEA